MKREDPREIWVKWCTEGRSRAEKRWEAVKAITSGTWKGDEWLKQTKMHLVTLVNLGILQPNEQGRLRQIDLRELDPADQRRVREKGLTRNLYAYGIARDSSTEGRLASRALRLTDGRRLRESGLGLLVFIDENEAKPIGLNIHIRGKDPARMDRNFYIRYERDIVQLGSGPVAHFNTHWHAGDDPEAPDAEDHDPRLPSLPLDPLAVLDVLVETFYPRGPDDLSPEPE